MKLALALAVVAAFSACKRSSQETAGSVPIKEVVAGVPMIDFEAPEAKFSARLPAEWNVRSEKQLSRDKGVVLSYAGLRSADRTRISIFKYPELDPYTDARKYAETMWQLSMDNKQPAIAEEKIGGTTVLRFHYERMPYPKRTRNSDRPDRFDFALFPVKGGFYQIQHWAPSDSYEKTLPVFEAVVRSFKPLP